MCGITGIFSANGTFTGNHVQKMTDRLGHRGPDHGEIAKFDFVSLGHRRLSILDLSPKANQPMKSASGRYTIVYNGEVYNFREIGDLLAIPFKTSSDTEVVIEAFAKWGPGFVNRLNGMFSMAIYDNEKQSLHLWRDRMGIKPLYYYYDGNNFAFASELKALLELPIKRSINKEAVKDFLFLEYIPEPHTVFRHIYKLEKGHSLKVSATGLKKKPYYDLLEKLNFDQKRKSENNHINEFDELLTRSVKRRTISDVPVGAFLSGGTDSSAICAKFREVSPEKINTYTIGFTEKEFDESRYAKAVARHLNTNHHHSIITPEDAVGMVEKIYDYYDEPFAASSVIPTLLVSQKAAKDVKVVLTGDGGDELFMGYGYYFWSKRLDTISRFGGKTGRMLTAAILGRFGSPYQKAARMIGYEDSHRMWLNSWSQEQGMFNEKEISKLTGEPYLHKTTFPDWEHISRLSLPNYDKISLFDIRHYLSNNLLHKVDIASMSTGLEARVPFLDHEMVEFAINLPNTYKIHGKTQKYILKKWLEKRLPHQLVYRIKWGFPAPVNHWLEKELQGLIEQKLSTRAIEKTALFDPRFVRQIVDSFNAGDRSHYKRVWTLLSFQMWYEKYMP